LRAVALFLSLSLSLIAHVGVNDVFFEGMAGKYPLYVTIRPPVVIPGVAEISIRSAAKDVTEIRITPMTLSGAGSKYPPTPDVAVRSKEDPQLFTGGLWIMGAGAWQVRAMVKGERGEGVVSIPVPAMSQKLTTMDPLTGGVLLGLMLLLAAGVVGIAGAAVREAGLRAGTVADSGRIRAGRIAMGVGLLAAVGIIWFGKSWWEGEAADYAQSIYQPMTMQASLKGGKLHLQLAGRTGRQSRSLDDFVLDHGHLMHLYLVREPKLDVVYHLHPEKSGPGLFELVMPTLPSGDYKIFADVVHANGFPETISAALAIESDLVGKAASVDDAGAQFYEVNLREAKLADGGKVRFESTEKIVAGRGISLRFVVEDAEGNPAANLRPYLGMPAHLAIFKKDLTVFSHIHPNGNISMAAFEMAQTNLLPLNGNVLVSSHGGSGGNEFVPAEFHFPFGFPSSGNYRMILQFARRDLVETVAIDVDVDR
jgi:hypothetical protein